MIILICFVLLSTTIEAKTNITVFVDKKNVHYDEQPLLINGRTMVPIRKTMEALGSTVQWDQKTQKTIIQKNQHMIILKNGSKTSYQNGIKMDLDAPAFIKNGRTYVPLRFLSEAFQYHVDWNGKTQTINIKTPPKFASQQVKIPIIMYHHIEKHSATGAVISPERFREHMIALKNKGFQTITDKELFDFLVHNKPLPYKPILITFDDGYKSNIIYAYPILKELKMKATINLITSKVIDEDNPFPNEIPKLSWEDARNTKDVFSFQSHTHNLHYKGKSNPHIAQSALSSRIRLPNGELESQEQFEHRIFQDLLLSKKLIEEKLQQPVMTLAYPYGEYSETTILMAKKAGYLMALTVEQGKVTKKNSNLFQLPRINGHGEYTGQQLINEINKY